MSSALGADALPHFRRRAQDPALPPGAVGVLVHTSGIEQVAGGPRWPLRGCFRVPRVEGSEPQSVLLRVVLSVTDQSTHEIQARHAFRDELLFAEDVREEGPLVSGDFHVDLLKLFEFDVPHETYFVAASVGQEVSAIVRCTCQMPWVVRA